MSLVKLENIKKEYEIGKVKIPVLNNFNLEINSGEMLALAGPSGSGKTTILNLIGCIDTPTSGNIYINNRLCSRLNEKELTDLRNYEIGFIFQYFNLIPVLTVFENVELVLIMQSELNKKERKEKVEKVLKEVGLNDLQNRKPAFLSGGQQQRVAIARALVKNPKFVLADEPTANLDSKTGEEILKLIKRLNEEKRITFIFSTHDKMVMQFAKRLVQLQDGRIIEDEKK
ncbi:MAG TPA: ABC transporter ATP-binding protein [bacterium]|nr:ABC transporter ATP-binding protein [bacterium]HOL47504.1 ABC transporter ATP-binding protein [bacterium]HPQ19574.1 ABC transporter ATP-binding protein [bacterium]